MGNTGFEYGALNIIYQVNKILPSPLGGMLLVKWIGAEL
jgi:hypothetical protein